MKISKRNIIYRVRVLFYNEFCGCSGDEIVNEWHYTNIAAAKVKIEEIKKQFKTGTYRIDNYTVFQGRYEEYNNDFDKNEIILLRKNPYHDLEYLHVLDKPERIVVEDIEVKEDYDGEPIFESNDTLRFNIPLRGYDDIAEDLGLEDSMECNDEYLGFFENDRILFMYNSTWDYLEFTFEYDDDKESKEKVKKYFKSIC